MKHPFRADLRLPGDLVRLLYEAGRALFQRPFLWPDAYAPVVNPVSKLPAELAPLWRAAHDRLSSGRPVTRLRAGPLDRREQAAVADLLGLSRMPGEYVTVSLTTLDQILTESVGADTRAVVGCFLGPVGDRARDREQAAAERAALWGWLDGHPALARQPALVPWAQEVRSAGLIHGSVPRTREEVGRALQVLGELPASGVPLPLLADRVLGDPHGLDDGTRCAGLVQRALAAIYDVDVPENAQQKRALWERAGVADDELSAVVLTAGLRPAGDDVVSRILRLCTEAGQAAALTLGQLRASSSPAGRPAGLPERVWVFENPSVLAMALARFGRRCPPIVVTSGWPNSAVILLLQMLAEAGTRLSYHGDFDGEGLRIAAAVAARTGAEPWHMSSADYLAAVSQGPPAGRVSEAPWDADLAGHLRRLGITVAEERVGAGLLDELARHFST
jgi:uncharacterized protein (TIGR02679 family)